MEQLLGGEVYHYHTKLMMKDAHTGGSFVWHQDYGWVVSRGQPLSFWERVWSNAIELPVLVPMIIEGDRNAQMHYLTALNAESAEQMALLHLTRLFPRRKEAGPGTFCCVYHVRHLECIRILQNPIFPLKIAFQL